MSSTPATPSPDAPTDRELALDRCIVRYALTSFSIAFVAVNAVTLAVIVHNNRLETYPAVMDPAGTLMAAGAGVLILGACWFAWTRLRPPMIHATWIAAAMVAGYAAFSLVGVWSVLRPLFNCAKYDAAVKEFGDTFINAAKLTDAEVEASKLVGRVANDEAASAEELRAAIVACDLLNERLTKDAVFLTFNKESCRVILWKYDVSHERIEYYARTVQQTNDTSALLDSNDQLTMLIHARKLDLRGRLATMEQGMEQGAATPMDDDDAGSPDK